MCDQFVMPLGSLRGVGPVMCARLADAGLRCVRDLLLIRPLRVQHVPLRFLRELPIGAHQCAVVVCVKSVVKRPRSMVVVCVDGAERIDVVIPNARGWVRCIVPGSYWIVDGVVRVECTASARCWTAIHPSWTRYTVRTVYQEHRLIYPSISGVPGSRLEDMIGQAVQCVSQIGERVVEDLCGMHTKARSDADLAEYVRRIAASELRTQYDQVQNVAGIAPAILPAPLVGIELPFSMTVEQDHALRDVCRDLATTKPMSRVLQGDVGSGKTVVALAAAAHVMASGHSAVLMAPTEVLAQQHFATASQYLRYPLFLLTSSTKKTVLAQVRNHSGVCLIVGTHALVCADLPKYAFAIIDEQHKFGVRQRLKLRASGVHALSMSATPIPRSLHLMLMGYLQTSILRHKPLQSACVSTYVLDETRVGEVYERVAGVVAEGLLVYWVCPAISDNPRVEIASVEARAVELEALFGGQVGVLHSKVASKESVLERFTSGKTPILLSTTVIEVGIDVHRATAIVVEQSERFGLAQLHQLRGRVGRGRWPGVCFLMHGAQAERGALERLEFLSQCYDGFEIAEYDLRQRGCGDPLGSMQSGQVEFRFFTPEMGDLYDGVPSTGVERALWGRDASTVHGV